MRLTSDATRLGWTIVALILIFSGLRLVFTQEIYGRIRMADSLPVLEGWPVVAMGLAEVVVGTVLLYRLVLRRR